MGRFTQVQDNFSAGELSPLLKGRSNLDIYEKGLEECLNFTPLKSGGVQRRKGTKYSLTFTHVLSFWNILGDVLENVTDVHLIPYKIDASTQYFVVILKLETKITIQCYSRITNAIVATVDNQSSLLTTMYIPYATDIHKFQFAQSGTLLVLTHDSGDIPPLFITFNITTFKWYLNFICPVYLDNTAGVFNAIANLNLSTSYGSLAKRNHGLSDNHQFLSIPYTDVNSTLTEIASNSPPTATQLQSYNPYPGTPGDTFTAKMIGTWIKQTQASVTGVGLANQYVSIDKMNVTHLAGSEWAGKSKIWEIGAWNSEYGFPRCVVFFEQRLILGSTKRQPDTFWGSEIGNYRNFMTNRLAQDLASDVSLFNYFGAVTAADPFSFTVASNEINSIQWLAATRSLYSGTSGTEYAVNGTSNGALSNVNFSIKPESNKGSIFSQPVCIDSSVIYIGREGQRIYQLKYSETNGSVISKDLSVQGDKIEVSLLPNTFTSTFKSLCVNKSQSSVYALKSSATESVVVEIKIDDSLDSLGWSKINIGGSGYVTSMTTLQDVSTKLEDTFLAVKRSVLGVDKFSLELLGSSFEGESLTDTFSLSPVGDIIYYPFLSPIFNDCATVIYNAVASTAITHPFLRSIAVEGLADGVYFTATLDASGNATLASTANTVIFGLPYTSRIKTLPVNKGFETQGGSALLSSKRIDKLFVKMRKTRGIQFGPLTGNLLDMEFTGLGATALFTGDKSMAFKDSSDEPGQVTIEVSKPYPCTILQIGVRGMTSEV